MSVDLAGADRPLIYASFWGSRWQNDADHKMLAADVAKSLSHFAASSASGVFMQSSFFTSGRWYDGTDPTELSGPHITEAIQILIDRGAAPEKNGPVSDAAPLLIIFLDETLSLAQDIDAAGSGYHAQFETMRGKTCSYGIVASLGDIGEAGDASRSGQLAAAAATLVVAMLGNRASEPGLAGSGPVKVRGHDQLALGEGLLPLPSLFVERRIPSFRVGDEEMERYLAALALDEIPGAMLFLQRAMGHLKAKAAERAAQPAPASAAELREFYRPNGRLTFAERFAAMKFRLGEKHPDVELVARILDGVSESVFAEIRQTYFAIDAVKYADIVFWTYIKLNLVRDLGLDVSAPKSIWDIGCGGGQLSRVCEHFGHRTIGTDQDHPVYGKIAAALGVERRVDRTLADTPTTDLGRKFDVVTAIAIEFNHHFPRTNTPRYWTLDNWKFFFNDLIDRQLNFPARIYMDLNCERRAGGAVYNVELMRLCADHGADVDERGGLIDWKLNAPIRIT